MADKGAHATEEDPAAAFLAQQETEIAVIENDGEGFGDLDGADDQQLPEPQPTNYEFFGEEPSTVNGDLFQESNGPTDNYAAIAQVDMLRQEPESLRKWREEQKTRLEVLDAASKAAEAEWRERAKKELHDWSVQQTEQMEMNKANNRMAEEMYLEEINDTSPGSEWERVARLCDFNPKTNKNTKDVSRMRAVLLSLKETPLVRD